MRTPSWLALTLAAASIAPATVTTLAIISPVSAQTVKVEDVTSAMNRARAQLVPIRQRLERAQRANQIEDRDAALADMKRVLDDVAPKVQALAGDVESQRSIHGEFDRWMADYDAANISRDAGSGDFFMMMSDRWSQLAPEAQGGADENKPAAFSDLVADPSLSGFGMPRTLSSVRALDRYLTEIQTHPDYDANKLHENVASDLEMARKARSQASNKLADAASAVLTQATTQPLDQAGRDRVWTMLEKDLPAALAGSPRLEPLQAKARSLVNGFDRGKGGDAASPDEQQKQLTELGDSIWPTIAARYAAVESDPLKAKRGELIRIRDARLLPADSYRNRNADFDLALLVNGRPVLCMFDPVVRLHVANILAETKLKSLPAEGIEAIGIVRAVAQVDRVQAPGSTPATTNPAGSEGESSPQTQPTLATTDGIVVDILAIHAGPAAIGVDPTPAQAQSPR